MKLGKKSKFLFLVPSLSKSLFPMKDPIVPLSTSKRKVVKNGKVTFLDVSLLDNPTNQGTTLLKF